MNKPKVEITYPEKWTHDGCGGEVDTSGIYWKCRRCGKFVFLWCCNGNSAQIERITGKVENDR